MKMPHLNYVQTSETWTIHTRIINLLLIPLHIIVITCILLANYTETSMSIHLLTLVPLYWWWWSAEKWNFRVYCNSITVACNYRFTIERDASSSSTAYHAIVYSLGIYIILFFRRCRFWKRTKVNWRKGKMKNVSIIIMVSIPFIINLQINMYLCVIRIGKTKCKTKAHA